MAIAIYDTIEEIPEDLRAEATNVDGKFHLKVDGLTNKVKDLLTKNKTYKTVYDKFVDIGDKATPDQIRKALQDMADEDKREQATAERIRVAVEENNKARQKDIDTAASERQLMQTTLESQIIDNELIREVTAADGDINFVPTALRGSVKTFKENGTYVAKVVDKDGKARLSAATGQPMTIKDLVAEARADKKYAPVFKAAAASGAGTSGAGAGGAGAAGAGGTATRVQLTSAQAKNAQEYRAAMAKVGNDATKIDIVDAVAQ